MYRGRSHQQPPQVGKDKGEARDLEIRWQPLYCTYHQSYSHNMHGCWDIVNHLSNQRENNRSQIEQTLDKVVNLGMMIAKIGTAPQEGERMMVEDVKKVEGIKGAPQPMQDASPFEKSIPYSKAHALREKYEMPKGIKREKPKIPNGKLHS